MPKLMKFICKPEKDFEVPNSDGYSLYSALLTRVGDSNGRLSSRIHDTPNPTWSISGLSGKFKRAKKDHHKLLKANELYGFKIGIVDSAEIEIFQSIIGPLIFEEKCIPLTHGKLKIMETESTEQTFSELVKIGKSQDIASIKFKFMTPTCIQYGNSQVTEMFPHRIAVFNSLFNKWNRVCPEGFEINLNEDQLGRYLFEKSIPKSYRTHSVVVNKVYDGNKGHRRPIFRQGFTGKCEYVFSGEDKMDGFKEIITTLAKFSEYSGVGSAVSRGCGAVRVLFN